MELVALQVFLSLVVELIIIRSMCMVLDMRSNALYVVLHLCCYALSYWLTISGAPHPMRMLIINLLCNILLPIAISRGPISSRLLRTMTVNFATLSTELVAEFLYTLSKPEGSVVQRSLIEGDSPVVFLIYCALVPMTAIVQESVIVACRRIDSKPNYQIALPGILLITLSFASFVPLVFRVEQSLNSRAGFYLMATTYAVSSLLVSLGISAIAQRDAQISRANADHIAMKRQAKHARDQVVAAAQRSADMARLRHDLANQVGLVDRLVAQGKGAEADRYLTALQEQARELGRPVSTTWQEPKELS